MTSAAFGLASFVIVVFMLGYLLGRFSVKKETKIAQLHVDDDEDALIRRLTVLRQERFAPSIAVTGRPAPAKVPDRLIAQRIPTRIKKET